MPWPRVSADARKKLVNAAMPSLEDATLLALEAHRGQKDKGGEPYILHALRVMLRMTTEHEKWAAVLHDVVEDGGINPQHQDHERLERYRKAWTELGGGSLPSE